MMNMTIIDIATLYLDALVSHDADSVPLAPDVRRMDNGAVVVEGADAFRAIISREPAAATSGFRWIVDDDQAIVFYDLDADMGGDELVPAYIGERFTVRADRIEEIEVVYTAGPGKPRPERPDRHRTGSGPRDEVLSVSKAYVAALVSHDASAVPLADDVWRIENGGVTADGADNLRTSLESEIMHTIQEITDESWFSGSDGAAVFYTLRARAGDDDMFVRIAERFRVVDSRLVEIEAVFAPIAQ